MLKRAFQSFAFQSHVVDALKRKSILLPTDIQKTAIPLILKGKTTVVAAETGSGKSLTYLLPIIQRVHENPDKQTLILVPSELLAKQVHSMISEIDSNTALKTCVLSKLHPRHHAAISDASVVISTPRRLLQEATSDDLVNLERLVLDECDMLLSGGFEKDSKQILGTLCPRDSDRQVILVGISSFL